MPAEQNHYFHTDPTTSGRRRTLTVRLAGKDVEVVSAAGVFSADRLDLGTSVLLREVPDPPGKGTLLDLGCGWGPLALTLAMLSPDADVVAVDVNRRSRELTGENASALGLSRVTAAAPEAVDPTLTFDVIWSNPPIRIGKPALHQLLLTWLPRLAAGGDAYLVVARNLGADSLRTWLTGALGTSFAVTRHASAKGFRILRVHRHLMVPSDPA